MKRLFALLFAGAAALSAAETRLKEITSIEGVRDNQLIGSGLVVGLNRTGDKAQTMFPAQELANMLRRMGLIVNPLIIAVRNIASVMVTATLPPFAQPGTHIDVTAGAIGDATSLQGGLLLLTPLKAADGQTYAVAQGSLVLGGYTANGGAAGGKNTVTLNHPTAGRIPGGAIVEKAPPSVEPAAKLRLQLDQADFSTAARIVDVLNRHFGGPAPIAHAESAALVAVDIPESYASRPVEFVAEMEDLTVEPDHREKVIINEKTGTIVLGKDIRITPVSILHGSLTVEVQTTLEASQPAPYSAGQTVVLPQTRLDTKEEKARNVILQKGATVEQLVRALEGIGSTPRDIIAVLESMRSAGALDADIEVL